MSKKYAFNDNIQHELSQRNNKIELLSKEKMKLAKSLSNLQADLKSSHKRNKELEIEIQNLTMQILEMHRKYDDEKRRTENMYNEQIKILKTENENYKSKRLMVNELAREKKGLLRAFDKVLQERNNILIEHDKMMREKEVNNQIKVSNLKKKMIDSVNETQAKINELNVQCMDTNNKLTLLHNYQLMLKLEYQTQDMEKLNAQKESLEKKIYELNKDIQIHKKVEISLAEKNKKLEFENKKLKGIKTKGIKKFDKIHLMLPCNSSINLGFNSYEKTTINSNNNNNRLEQKVLKLEKQLQINLKEYNELKDKYDSIEKILKNYEQKYSGLYHYFEECLQMFLNDDELKNNKDIFINLESMKRGDFNNLSNEEKYSTLVILMKYLMPLIHNTDALNNINSLSNINLKFHFKNHKKNFKNEINKSNNIGINKLLQRLMKEKYLNKNLNNQLSLKNIKYNSFDGILNDDEKISILKMPLLSPRKETFNTGMNKELK